MTIRLRQEIARGEDVLLLQDNTPGHTSQVAMTAPTECWFEIFPHPHILLIWLLTYAVPKTEIPYPWYTVWRQQRRHRGSKRVLGAQELPSILKGYESSNKEWLSALP